MPSPNYKHSKWVQALAISEVLNKGGIFCKTTEEGEIVSLDPTFDIGFVFSNKRLPSGFYILPEYNIMRRNSKETKKHPLLCVTHIPKEEAIGPQTEILALTPLEVFLAILGQKGR